MPTPRRNRRPSCSSMSQGIAVAVHAKGGFHFDPGRAGRPRMPDRHQRYRRWNSTAKLTLIFERFQQLSTENRRGLGLGLYISKRLVEAHQGRIWAESQVGDGTTFLLHVTIGLMRGTPLGRNAVLGRSRVLRDSLEFLLTYIRDDAPRAS
jgi:hypothetical protein